MNDNRYGLYVPNFNWSAQSGSVQNAQRALGLRLPTGTDFSKILNMKARQTAASQTAASQTAARQSAGNAQFSDIPVSMDSIFEEAAEKYQVDVNLLKAIGKAESDFDASCVSSAGAMGVMQLMPETAESLGVSDPFDERQNIMGGASCIAGLLKQYDGDIQLALAAYNAGSGNVRKYGGIPPFKETQNYVKKVMRYAGEDIQTGQTVVSGTGQQSAVSGMGNAAEQQTTVSGIESGAEQQAAAAEYYTFLVDMMRVQMEMKLADIFDFQNEEEQQF